MRPLHSLLLIAGLLLMPFVLAFGYQLQNPAPPPEPEPVHETPCYAFLPDDVALTDGHIRVTGTWGITVHNRTSYTIESVKICQAPYSFCQDYEETILPHGHRRYGGFDWDPGDDREGVRYFYVRPQGSYCTDDTVW